MSRTEIGELIAIVMTLVCLALLSTYFPSLIKVSTLILTVAVTLLFQGLLRDLWYLWLKRSAKSQDIDAIYKRCMCLESVLGLSLVVVGLMALGIGINTTIVVAQNILIGVFAAVLIGGFLIKDYVVSWNPWRIYQEKDHMNIIFSWKNDG